MATEQQPTGEQDRQSRMYAMLAHLTALSGYIGIPFGNILGPLIVWLLKKDEYPLVDDQGKESMNFQISLMIYGLTIILIPIIYIFGLVEVIIASVQADKGVAYRYPLTIRFIK